MKTTTDSGRSVLTVEALADRWGLPVDTLKRRLKLLELPAVNVGTAKAPDWRFRAQAIEAWEAANETRLGVPAAGRTPEEPVPVPVGAPPGLEGYDPFKPRRKLRRGPK